MGAIPTVNNSGNGFHIIQPIECPILEEIEEFQKYKDKGFPLLSQELLRFAEDFLSYGKADKGHHPPSSRVRLEYQVQSMGSVLTTGIKDF